MRHTSCNCGHPDAGIQDQFTLLQVQEGATKMIEGVENSFSDKMSKSLVYLAL